MIGKLFNPWHLRSAEVQAFCVKDDQYHQPIGEDANVFASRSRTSSLPPPPVLRHGGATAEDGLASVRAMVALAQSVTTGDLGRAG